MFRYLGITMVALLVPSIVQAQGATDAYQLAKTELRGTARFMSMAGAFGALGGDLSVLGQNPGGIGVYRSSDIGVTVEFNIQSAQSIVGYNKQTQNNFVFNCNNAGYIGAVKLDSDVMPNFNRGITYNRAASFNRRYSGYISNLNSSMTNFIADQTNKGGWTANYLAYTKNYNPYLDSYAHWMSILA